MAERSAAKLEKSIDRDADLSVELAVQRTALAHDQMLLSWVRTVLTLLATGVAFDKGAQLLHRERLVAGTAVVGTGHLAGLILAGASFFMLISATWRYAAERRAFSKMAGAPVSWMTAQLLCAILVIVLSGAVFVALLATGD